GEHGIEALLEMHHNCYCWDPIRENGNIIALSCTDCPIGGSISLEPGGQLELSGAPLKTVHETE
ncbi:MAG: glutamate--cysteine ligase, partial [Gammaproteobacteria bacterium]|nr:glutamate--cysteine ligase [Gammaproteobacteria bacterium]